MGRKGSQNNWWLDGGERFWRKEVRLTRGVRCSVNAVVPSGVGIEVNERSEGTSREIDIRSGRWPPIDSSSGTTQTDQ